MEPTILQLKSQLEQQGHSIEEIRASQIKVADALLGSFDRDGVGLLEQQRANVQNIAALQASQREQQTQLDELVSFRNEIRKVVAVIALAIPLVFEMAKALIAIAWQYAMKK